MATTYTSTITVNVWKEHTCACCGSKYRYLFQRKKTGSGGSPDIASANAERAVVNALAHEVDIQPCPECGLIQPDMVAVRRKVGHWIICGVAACILPVFIILTACDVMTLAASAWACAITCAICLLIHMAVGLGNPNANLEANANTARSRLERGVIWAPDSNKPDPNGEVPHTGLTAGTLVLYVLLGLSAVFCALPDLARAASGWPLNDGWYAAVVGPGDEPYVYFKDKLTSVKGYWRGNPAIHAVCVEEPALQNGPLSGSSKNDNWSQKISVSNKESKTGTQTIWCRIKLPTDSNLAGKTLRLHITMAIHYPHFDPPSSFHEADTSFQHDVTVKLASPGAGSTYRSLWYLGVFGGAAGFVVLSALLALLAGALRNKALPTEVIVPEGANNQ